MRNENLPDVDWAGLETDLAEAARRRRQAAVDRLLAVAGVTVDEEGDETARWLDQRTGNHYELIHLHDPMLTAEHYLIETQSVLLPNRRSTIMFDKDSPDIIVLGGTLAEEPPSQTNLRAVLEKTLDDALRIVSCL